MTYQATYIDDFRSEATQYIKRLNAVGGLDVNYLAPSPNLSLAGIRPGTQLFFVDWDLSGRQESGIQVDYHGGTFAQRLREKFSEMPIVLTAKKHLLTNGRGVVNPYLFDTEILKDEIATQPSHVVKKCINLITGYQKLTAADKTWQGLLSVLGAGEDEEEQIGEAAPPLLKRGGGTTWLVPEMANWLQEVLLAYPGILYDPLHAATYLGIDIKEFLMPDMQELFRDARYTGALAPAEGSWWKDKLTDVALDVIVDAQMSGISLHRHFPKAFAQVHGRALQLAECVYSKKKPAPRVCYLLKKPVRIEYSLDYQPDNRPRVMDYARVSFRAIRTNGEVFDEYFPPSSRHLVDEIRGWEKDELSA
jgi:hypothetical protein